MLRKLAVFSFSMITVTLLLFFHEPLLQWIQSNERESIVVTTLIATLMSSFPVIPYPIVGGVIGAAFGPVLGALIIWMGSTFASILFFAMIRYGGFHQWGEKTLRRYPVTKKLTILFERNAFLSITMMRMIPVIPSIIINTYAAASRVSFPVYTIASGLGKIPAMTLFAVIGYTIVTDPQELVVMLAIYGSFLAIVYGGYRLWTKRMENENKDVSLQNNPPSEY
ncbi:Uncharacterized membrane protein YdjX, TVP38/TMEM64 family, SNARE-associated domain [Evansella caseinilytica]|uniref:TVP38/TMEM64 family membrane protein n=1 Tax=Evansella caseinilytica TaxID=1503961 RepID=A0A1H3V0H4_9BACI|nr:TVP38/TMEM64 family protein [Evansella caseinilytica]SDZ68154.1 Uncharacterized membrane protein YdjX, TVP38/TMEM64 family, SNARE-associated domain [Evansella caseinilytica]